MAVRELFGGLDHDRSHRYDGKQIAYRCQNSQYWYIGTVIHGGDSQWGYVSAPSPLANVHGEQITSFIVLPS
jgi:hypothetical protein